MCQQIKRSVKLQTQTVGLVVLMVVNSVEEVSFQLALEADGQFHGIEV